MLFKLDDFFDVVTEPADTWTHVTASTAVSFLLSDMDKRPLISDLLQISKLSVRSQVK